MAAFTSTLHCWHIASAKDVHSTGQPLRVLATSRARSSLPINWPATYRTSLTRYATESGAAPLIKLSEPVVEAGIYDAPRDSALVLANFTCEAINALHVELPTRGPVNTVRSLAHGGLRFESVSAPLPWVKEGYTHLQRFTLSLGHDDVVLVE